MSRIAAASVADLEQYLQSQAKKTLLRFLTCGSVDDGKSTLIGRLLYESKMLYDDQLATLEAESRRLGSNVGELDFALLLDGLAAELDLTRPLYYALRYVLPILDTPVPAHVLREAEIGRPPSALRCLVDALFVRMLRAPHAGEAADRLAALARGSLCVRARSVLCRHCCLPNT
jgi:hypothetical protein